MSKKYLCMDCDYWWNAYRSNEDNARYGECCRFPPTVKRSNNRDGFIYPNPETCETDFCGEFKLDTLGE